MHNVCLVDTPTVDMECLLELCLLGDYVVELETVNNNAQIEVITKSNSDISSGTWW